MDATTIHSALKISPVTNEELRVFEQQKGKKAADLSECRVFVVEEVSMVDKELFRIIKRTIPSCAVILGLGDKDQIRPVNTEGITELSPFFDEEILMSFAWIRLCVRQKETQSSRYHALYATVSR